MSRPNIQRLIDRLMGRSTGARIDAAAEARDDLVASSRDDAPPSPTSAPAPAPDGTRELDVGFNRSKPSLVGSWLHSRDGVERSADVALTRSRVRGNYTRTTAARADAVDVTLTNAGSGSVALSSDVVTTTGVRSHGGAVGLSRDSLDASFNLAHSGRKGVRVLGLVGSVSANREVADLGFYQGETPELQGTRTLELTHERGLSGSVSTGFADLTLGIGGSLTLERSRKVSYLTHVQVGEARDLLREEAQFLRDKARGLGIAADRLKVPTLERPDELRVGDELTVFTHGKLSGGLAVGGLATRAGFQGSVQGEFEVRAVRVDGRQVELTFTPTRVVGVQAFLDTMSPLEVSAEKVVGRSLSQSFLFDLADPEGKKAYQAALHGDLPGSLDGLSSVGPDAQELVTRMNDGPMPSGVLRTFAEVGGVTSTSGGGGFNVDFLKSLVPMSGLSVRETRFHERRALSDGEVGLDLIGVGKEQRRELLLSGTETERIYAERRSVVSPDDGSFTREFGGLALTASFTDSRVRGGELNHALIDKLNWNFGLMLEPFSNKAGTESREVTLEFVLDRAALRALARAEGWKVEEVALNQDVDPRELSALVRTLSQNPDPEGRAERVQAFVTKQGLKGLGAIYRLLGGSVPLDLETTSSTYAEALRGGRSLSFEHEGFTELGDPAQLIADWCELYQGLGKVKKALAALAGDPLIDDEDQERLRAELEKVQVELGRRLDLAALGDDDRLRVYRALEGKWRRSDVEQALMDTMRVDLRAA